MNHRLFGVLPTGESVFEYFIEGDGIRASVIDFGAAVRTITVGGRDIAGGFDTIEEYLTDDSHQGGLVGRVANRIGGARFEMDGRVYLLPQNDGENCLHGGNGFDRNMWRVGEHCESAITLLYDARDGEEGFPARLSVKLEYRIESGALVINYTAVPEGKTPIALTNHTYFNLDGLGNDVKAHAVAIYADRYTAVGEDLIPTGERPEVAGTPYDLRTLKPIGEAIDALGGVDHNYLLSGEPVATPWGMLRHAATVESGGIRMQMYTDQEGVQLYTGNFLGSGSDFKGGVKQVKHGALCLEAQTEPNAVNHGKCFFEKGEAYRQTTVYAFELG